jgi:hypothetical protein
MIRSSVTQWMGDLRLSVKFTLVLLVISIVGFLACWAVVSRMMFDQAADISRLRANAAIEMMNSVRHYTSTRINPLLADDLAIVDDFIAETVPAYSAREVFEHWRTSPDYTSYFYKEAASNPTNPRDRADAFEYSLLEAMRADVGANANMSGFTTRDGIDVFYTARPLRVTNASCLQCHGDPAQAPASLIATYGSQNGFGWREGEVIAAQVVYVPASDVISRAQNWVTLLMVVFGATFFIILAAARTLLQMKVVRPMEQIAATARSAADDAAWSPSANQIASVSAIAVRGDEIGQTARHFKHLLEEVYAREQRLRQEVRRLEIQIDSAKREKEVRQITESEYFQDLQSKVKNLRRQKPGAAPE